MLSLLTHADFCEHVLLLSVNRCNAVHSRQVAKEPKWSFISKPNGSKTKT